MSAINEPLHGAAADEARDQLRARATDKVNNWRRTGQKMLDQYGGVDVRDHGAVVQAFGALETSLQHLLAALNAQAALERDR